jgi:hypothetical protein
MVAISVHFLLIFLFQIISYQEHYANGQPERSFEPILCLKCLKCCDSKEKHKRLQS